MNSKFTNRFAILLQILFVFSLSTGLGQEAKVKAYIDSSSIKIGDQIKFHIELQYPEGASVLFPVIGDRISGQIEIVKILNPDTLKENKSLKINYSYLITSFDSGQFTIPIYEIPYSIGNKKDTLRTDSLVLTVNYFDTDTATLIKDIKPPLKAPVNFAELWPYIAGFLGLLIIAFVIWYLVSKRKKGGIFAVAKPIEPAHIIALRELDNLRAKKLWQSNRTKEYFVELTEIIRKYIELRFDVQALEMTSDEIIEAFRYNNFVDPDSKNLLKDLFTLADLVKFAKAQPLPDENEVSMLNAYQFVNNTKVAEMNIATEDTAENDSNQVLNQ